MTHQINIDQICSIRTYETAICKDYVRIKSTHSWFRRLFNLGPTKEGFACRIDRAFGEYKIYSAAELLDYDKDIVIDSDNDVLYKPYAEITMSSGKTKTKYFETTDELNQFVVAIKGTNPFITIS